MRSAVNSVPTRATAISPRKQAAIALLIFVLLATAFINRALLPNYALLPLDLTTTILPWKTPEPIQLANNLLSDPFYSFYPRRALLTAAVRTGQLPLWNPYVMTGTPEVANPNFQLFYPPNLLAALVLPAYQALAWLAWFHLIATALLMFLFLRRHRLHWLACVIGGAAWMLNGYAIVWLENPHRLSTAAWFPGFFWAFEAAIQDRRISWAALSGVFLGLSILGGQAQFVFGIGLMLGLYGLLRWLYQWRARRMFSARPIGYLLVVGLIGLSIGSLLLLPAVGFADSSQRARFTSDMIETTGWPIEHIVTLIAPDFYGNPTTSHGYWGEVNIAELTAYFGVVALLLALTAPLIGHRRFLTGAAIVQMLVVLAISLGTPLARLLFLVPGAEFVPLGRTIFLIPFAGVWLAAVGIDGWLSRPITLRRGAVCGRIGVDRVCDHRGVDAE